MNQNKGYIDCFSDKNILPIIAKQANVRMPKTIISCSFGTFQDGDGNIISLKEVLLLLQNIGNVFIKPSVDSCSGIGCAVINVRDGVDCISGKRLEDLIKEKGDNFVVQELLKCSNDISTLYGASVNTFRVITYRWHQEIRVLPAIMRIGQGGNYLDNAHAGGLFIALDQSGLLHETAFTEFNTQYRRHPDSQVVFRNYQISNFEKVIDSAIRMHMHMPQIGCVNWDFTIDENEIPVLIEANLKCGSIWLIEMAHGTGAFGENTAEILKWLNFMNHQNAENLKHYQFGRMAD